MLSIGICDDDIHMLTYLEKLCQKNVKLQAIRQAVSF